MPPPLFFFFRISLRIVILLWFHINFRIIHSSPVKNVMGNLIKVALNLWIALAILGLLWFHINFSIISSNSLKNTMGNLIGIVLNP